MTDGVITVSNKLAYGKIEQPAQAWRRERRITAPGLSDSWFPDS
jgi:hypothetical protein